MEQKKGFFAALFDFSFSEFITTRIIKILYVVGMILAVLAALGLMVSGFTQSVGVGILFLILSPIVFLVYVIVFRVWLEFIIVVFRIAEHTEEIAKQGRDEV
ncbi:MAG: DUF4282 domain-containing protein [Chloroflexi bacterium]|nr:DUF4282 domain-containing protein [Chloroflexota bacterium]